MLRYLTAGESHGEYLSAILEGMPANVPVDPSLIDRDLARRQGGYGRGGRMKIERDQVKIISGVRNGLTLGSPLGLLIANQDNANWKKIMAVGKFTEEILPLTQPRPAHADLTGGLKYAQHDMRNILERSSARETAIRVAVGSVAKQLLAEFGITVISCVTNIGGVKMPQTDIPYTELFERAEQSSLRCPDETTTRQMEAAIDKAKSAGDTLGGAFEVVVLNAPPGLGSHVQWDRKLDGRLAYALMSIQAIKGVEVGMGFELGSIPGSAAHDEIYYNQEKGFYRNTNRAGGIEGGMSNGEPIVLRAVMKPIPTLMQPLHSVDTVTKADSPASKERSDVCAVPAAAVVGEAVAAFEITSAMLEKFGGDSLAEMKNNYAGFLESVKQY